MNRMLWKLMLAYLLALPAVLWCIYRSGQVLSEWPRDAVRHRDGLRRRQD